MVRKLTEKIWCTANVLWKAKEIGEGKGIIVRRPNADQLITIRKGEVDLQTLIDSVEGEIKEVDRIFEESNLPEKIDENLINNLIINIRKQIYKIWFQLLFYYF